MDTLFIIVIFILKKIFENIKIKTEH